MCPLAIRRNDYICGVHQVFVSALAAGSRRFPCYACRNAMLAVLFFFAHAVSDRGDGVDGDRRAFVEDSLSDSADSGALVGFRAELSVFVQ